MHIIHTQHGATVERQVLNKINKGLLQFSKIMTISFHMIRIDICHHGQYRLQIQK